MSLERGEDHITFEEVISNAKEIMLRDGNHVPILIMEADNKLVAGQIPDMPATHEERVELLRFLGQAAASIAKGIVLRLTTQDGPTGVWSAPSVLKLCLRICWETTERNI